VTRLDWSDPEVRKDALIVLVLFGVGFMVQIGLALLFVWVMEWLGWWDALSGNGTGVTPSRDGLRFFETNRGVPTSPG